MAANILNLPTEETLQAIASALTTMQGNVQGVKGNEETTYRTGQVNLTAANIGALPSNTTYVSSVNGGSGAVTGIATQQELNEVRNIAEGAGAAMSFANYATLVSDFNNAADDDYKLGQSIYINTLDVPDLWIYEVSDVQILYYYTTDEAFTDLLKQQGYVQIGYYKVAALETQKVDLTNYATLNTTQTFTGTKNFTDFSLINDYTNGKTLASYLSDIYTKTESDGKYVDLTSDQTIAGKKKFTDTPETKEMIFRNNVSSPTGNALSIQNDNGYNAKIRFNGRGFMFTAGSVYPTDNNVMDFGATNYLWKNIYVSGNLSNGTNSVSVANISNGLFNVINASDITSNTLTQAQYDLVTNGKPTVIKGTFLTLQNPILFSGENNGTVWRGLIVGCPTGTTNIYLKAYELYVSSKIISVSASNRIQASIAEINGKTLPSYPNSPTIPQVLTYGTNNALSWGDFVPTNAYASNSTTILEYATINNISISADTTYTLTTAPTGTYPEYKANITNTDTSNSIVITLPSGTIVKAENGITVSSNTFTIPADTTVVMSLQDDLALVMIKG